MREPVTTADRKTSKVRAFLAAIRVMPSVTKAADAAGIRRELHYRRYKADPVYRQIFDEAWEIGIGAMEDDAADKAMNGYKEPVVYQGRFTYSAYDENGKGIGEPLYILRPNAAMHMFLLRGAKPAKYRERYDHSITGNLNVTRFKGSIAELLATYRDLTQTDSGAEAGDTEAG